MAEDAVRLRFLQNVHDLQQAYHEAVKRLDDESIHAQYARVWRELSRYNAGDDATKAVWLLACCHTLLEPVADAFDIIERYRDHQEKLENYDRRRAIENG